jgi:hypothetical protein
VSRTLSHALWIPCLVGAIAGWAAPASAQQKGKNAAAEAFKACREQEKYGDATSCWKGWLDKHRSAAHEAEVLYAEEKVKDGEAPQDKPESEHGEAPSEAAPLPPGIGLSVIAHGTAALFFMNEGEQRFPLSPTQDATYSVPSFGYGGGFSVGYGLVKLLKWPHTHVRLGAERLVGVADGTGVAVTNADLAFEKGFPLGKKLKLYFAVGPSLTLVELKIVPPAFAVPDQTREVQRVTSTRFGGTGRAGLELALGSRLGARLEAAVRINSRGFYQPDEGSVIYWDFEQRRDSFSSAGARLGLVVMF